MGECKEKARELRDKDVPWASQCSQSKLHVLCRVIIEMYQRAPVHCWFSFRLGYSKHIAEHGRVGAENVAMHPELGLFCLEDDIAVAVPDLRTRH
jgi:hypothetical protein